jgi:hypothetical protein
MRIKSRKRFYPDYGKAAFQAQTSIYLIVVLDCRSPRFSEQTPRQPGANSLII